MKHLITVLALAVTAAATSAYAADAPAKEPTEQQTKMATCNKDAADIEGRRAQGLHEDLPVGEEGNPAGQDEDLQCRRHRQEGRRAQGLHEGMPEQVTDGETPGMAGRCRIQDFQYAVSP